MREGMNEANLSVPLFESDREGNKFVLTLLSHHFFNENDVQWLKLFNDDSFDFIYARLVLHYLPKTELVQALSELHRVLKDGGKLFVVVRSSTCYEATSKNAIFDLLTGLTTYTSNDGNSYSRFFHTENAIQEYLNASGFTIQYVKSYEEQLCIDFQRTQLSNYIDSLIEVLSFK